MYSSSEEDEQSSGSDETHQHNLSVVEVTDMAMVMRDSLKWLKCSQKLLETQMIVLISPVVALNGNVNDTSDPFEPLGRSLAKRHPRVRQVPYFEKRKLSSTHMGLIKRAHFIIVCITVAHDHPIRLDVARATFDVRDGKPCIIVLVYMPLESWSKSQDYQSSCRSFKSEHMSAVVSGFPTVVEVVGYFPQALEAAAAAIFEQSPYAEPHPCGPSALQIVHHRKRPSWVVEAWVERQDVACLIDLWKEIFPPARYAIDAKSFASSVVQGSAYAKHYAVRDPGSRELLGFCSMHLPHINGRSENLIAYISLLLVRPRARSQGIGSVLHSHMVQELQRERGISQAQIRCEAPRVFSGLPTGLNLNLTWLERRGWRIDPQMTSCDMLLKFPAWNARSLQPQTNYRFRAATREDMKVVLEFVTNMSKKQDRAEWIHRYSSTHNTLNIKDILVGISGNTLVATALKYTPFSNSTASESAYAARVGFDVGRCSCVCIDKEWVQMKYGTPSKFTAEYQGLFNGLLEACIRELAARGVEKMLYDDVTTEHKLLSQYGFKVWETYRTCRLQMQR